MDRDQQELSLGGNWKYCHVQDQLQPDCGDKHTPRKPYKNVTRLCKKSVALAVIKCDKV